MRGNLAGAALGLGAMGAYATHDAVIKLLGASYSPLQTAFFVALLSLPVLAVVAARRPQVSLWPRHPGWVGLRTLCMTLNVLSAMTAFALLPLTQVYAILFTMPLLITLLSVPMLGERIGPHRLVAVLLGLAGVLIVLRPGQAQLGIGHLCAIVTALCGALSAVIARRLGGSERTLVLVLWPVLLNLGLCTLALPFVYRPMPGADLGLAGLVALFGLIGAVLNVRAYRTAEAAVVAPMQYSQILWATLYGWLLFSELPDSATLLGITVIVGSGLYILWRETRAPAAHRLVLQAEASGEGLPSPSISGFRRLLRR